MHTTTFIIGLLTIAVVAARGSVLAEGITCRRIYYAILDLSGSYSEVRPRAIDDLKQLVATLHPEDCVLARTATKESFADANFILSLTFPVSSRKLDPARERRVTQAKRNALARLDHLKSAPQEPFTDLLCAVSVAAQTLRAIQSQAEKRLLVYTDLEENRRRKDCETFRLDGVEVEFRLVPRGHNPSNFGRLVRQWTERVTKAGATVEFIGLDRIRIAEGRQ